MTAAIRRIWQTALFEWRTAVRSRRALVLLLIYLSTAVLCMYGTISVLGRMEGELASVLQLPTDAETGVVSETLWKSKTFKRIVRSAVGDSLVFEDISKRHPMELAYAWVAFLFAPMLVVFVAGGRVAGDLHSGAARYALMRVTRFEWSLGKYVGQALMIALALAASALGAWVVVCCRLPVRAAAALCVPMFAWGVKAWIYSLAWLGVALGLSHLSRSSAKAVSLGFLVLFVFSLWPTLLNVLVEWAGLPAAIRNLDALVPSSAENALWRSAPAALVSGAAHLLLLGLAYLMAGAAAFARRDA